MPLASLPPAVLSCVFASNGAKNPSLATSCCCTSSGVSQASAFPWETSLRRRQRQLGIRFFQLYLKGIRPGKDVFRSSLSIFGSTFPSPYHLPCSEKKKFPCFDVNLLHGAETMQRRRSEAQERKRSDSGGYTARWGGVGLEALEQLPGPYPRVQVGCGFPHFVSCPQALTLCYVLCPLGSCNV